MDWWLTVVETLRKLTAQRPGKIRALSVDATSSTLLLCDGKGLPLGPALMYDDRRAHEQAALIARFAPADSPARGPGSALAKLLYLENRKGGTAAAHALHQADWINGRLTGKFGLADENNVLKLGYDPVNRCWPEWMSRLPLSAQLLPVVLPVGTRLGIIGTDVARHLGLPPMWSWSPEPPTAMRPRWLQARQVREMP